MGPLGYSFLKKKN